MNWRLINWIWINNKVRRVLFCGYNVPLIQRTVFNGP